jgi:phosphoglucomutase
MESETLPYKLKSVYTTAFNDQNPGTSGLRKKVTHFQQKNYIENFVQSLFNAHNQENYLNKSLIVGGDGRFYNEIAANIIIKIAAANGIRIVILAENCIMSTPAISLLIRNQPANECFGAFILTASHNPGGPHEDLGIKFNNAAGAPAPENVTAKLFQCTKDITSYKILDFDGNFSLINDTNIKVLQNDLIEREFTIRIESSTKLYVEKMQELFDFDLFKTLFERQDFKFAFDAMHGASGPYALEIFNKILGVDLQHLYDCNILPDFGGLHPDPNLVYAKNIVEVMDIACKQDLNQIPDFGAACDGDADRNMILGKRFFVAPSDSLAVIVANYKSIKNLNRPNGLNGVARSMPTSGALDRVANKMGIKVYYLFKFSVTKPQQDGNFLEI